MAPEGAKIRQKLDSSQYGTRKEDIIHDEIEKVSSTN